MDLNLASLNVRGLRDSSKCRRMLGELKNLGVNVAAVQGTHFTCCEGCRVMESDFDVFLAYDSRTSAGVGSASDPLSKRRGWTAEEICSHWNWAPGSSFLNNSEFSLTWRLARNALPVLGLNYKAGLADLPD